MTRDEWLTLNNNHRISDFLSFYNLRLEVKETKRGKLELSAKSFRRLMKFFENETRITHSKDSPKTKKLIENLGTYMRG